MLHAAQRTVLANGLTLVALPRPGSPSTTFLLAMAGGSRFDPPDRTGLAFLLSRLLDKGGGAYSSREISERIENAGAVLSTTTTRRLVTMVLTCVADAVIDLVPCVVGGARAPSLMPDEINRQRLEVRTLLAQDRSLPAVRAVEALMAALYPDPHPYGRPARGTPESLDAISRADLEAHHYRYCTPERAI